MAALFNECGVIILITVTINALKRVPNINVFSVGTVFVTVSWFFSGIFPTPHNNLWVSGLIAIVAANVFGIVCVSVSFVLLLL